MASSSCLWALQKAMYGVLIADSALAQLAHGVYDGVAPPETEFPYVVLGEATEVGSDILSRVGREATVTIHVWSNYRGDQEIKRITDRIVQLLDRVRVTMTDWNCLIARYENAQTFFETDQVRHSVIRMHYTVSPRTV